MKTFSEPATEAQKKYLNDLGVSFPNDLTKEQGIRLIGSQFKANSYQKSIFKFFKIEFDKKINQTQAQDLIDKLFLIEENKKKWKAKLDAEKLKENLVVLKFFNIEIPKDITPKMSKDMIDELFEDEEKEKLWDKHLDDIAEQEDRIEERKENIRELLQDFNLVKKYYNCDKIPNKLFVKYVEEMESQGYTLEQLSNLDNRDYYFDILLKRYPELKK